MSEQFNRFEIKQFLSINSCIHENLLVSSDNPQNG